MRKKRSFLTSCLVILLTLAMLAGSMMTALAATSDIISTTATGSITIYKYDLTRATEKGVDTSSYSSTGAQNGEAEIALADYALQGVKFTYLKVGDIDTYTTTESDVAKTIQVIYGIDSSLAEILGLKDGSNYNITPVKTGDTGLLYYTSDTINSALASKLESANAATKNALQNYITKTNIGTTMTETNASGMTTATNLAVGLYLIVETYVPESVKTTTDPFFVSVPMTESDGSEWFYDIYVYPKNQTNNPTIDKQVKSDETTATFGDTATASEGDIVYYRIITKLPTITSASTYLTKYNISDTLASGLTYTKNTDEIKYVTVKLYQSLDSTEPIALTLDTDYTLTYDDTKNTMTIALTTAGLEKINPDYSDYYLVVEYQVKVNSDSAVVLGDSGNPNTVGLTYARTNADYYQTIEDEAIVYTYGLNLTKEFSDSSEKSSSYSDVKFTLYNEIDRYYVVATEVSEGVYYVTGKTSSDEEATTAAGETEAITNATTFTPSSSGSLKIYGLEADTYTLTEVSTAAGYSLLSEPITIVINATSGTSITAGVATETEDKTAETSYTNPAEVDTTNIIGASATVDSEDATMDDSGNSANALVKLTVINTKSFTLPQTGGLGTILFTLAGAALIIFGVIYLVKGRKKGEKQDS